MEKNGAFIKRLLATFKVEAGEHIAAITSGLLELEQELSAERRAQVVEAVFREVHSMKGAARSVNQADIENVCQSFESVIAALKRGELAAGRTLLDLLHESVNALVGLVSAIGSVPAASDKAKLRDLISELSRSARASSPAAPSAVPSPPSEQAPRSPAPPIPPVAPGTVRISKDKLDSILLQGEGFLGVKQAIAQQASDLRDFAAAFSEFRKEWAKFRADLQTVSEADGKGDCAAAAPNSGLGKKYLEFFESQGNRLTRLRYALASLEKSAMYDQRSVGAMVDGLLDDLKTVSMRPFSSLLEMMPKIVRDLSRDQGKEAVLTIRGGEIEIDKRILDEMREPLIHLVRNCVDHGIEKPDERAAWNKKTTGTVTIDIVHREGKAIELAVSDDGRGISLEKIKVSAVKLGLLSQQEAQEIDERRLAPFVFHSGVTASPIITDISGRGLGLAIVRERAERLGGTVVCETEEGRGATFRITLPLSLATFRGVLVRVEDRPFLIPTTSLERTLRVRKDEIKTVENRETVMIEGKAVPFVPLGAVLELPRNGKKTAPEFVQAAVLGAGEDRIAFGVDEIAREQEILVKDLGKQLARVRNVSAATVLGTGKVVLILNVPDLMKSAVKVSSAVPVRAAAETPEARKSILVVEDSITSRTLLKNIIEASGYDVQTAVDGLEAFTALKTGAFDLVVSDVDMPRMNGFDLTAKIRADKKLADMPVVLVTALESREDRERGVDVGANAYIVKSSFDKSNLLEAIRRLI
jgi:two-component system, chemotaxis family, sensor kinase CheA